MSTGVLGLEQVANFFQQVSFYRSGFGVFFSDALALGLELVDAVHRGNQNEVDNGGNNEEVNRGGNDGAKIHEGGLVALADKESETGVISSTEGSNNWVDQVFGESRDNGGEGGANNYRNSKFNNIAAQDEIFEAFKQDNLQLWVLIL